MKLRNYPLERKLRGRIRREQKELRKQHRISRAPAVSGGISAFPWLPFLGLWMFLVAAVEYRDQNQQSVMFGLLGFIFMARAFHVAGVIRDRLTSDHTIAVLAFYPVEDSGVARLVLRQYLGKPLWSLTSWVWLLGCASFGSRLEGWGWIAGTLILGTLAWGACLAASLVIAAGGPRLPAKPFTLAFSMLAGVVLPFWTPFPEWLQLLARSGQLLPIGGVSSMFLHSESSVALLAVPSLIGTAVLLVAAPIVLRKTLESYLPPFLGGDELAASGSKEPMDPSPTPQVAAPEPRGNAAIGDFAQEWEASLEVVVGPEVQPGDLLEPEIEPVSKPMDAFARKAIIGSLNESAKWGRSDALSKLMARALSPRLLIVWNLLSASGSDWGKRSLQVTLNFLTVIAVTRLASPLFLPEGTPEAAAVFACGITALVALPWKMDWPGLESGPGRPPIWSAYPVTVWELAKVATLEASLRCLFVLPFFLIGGGILGWGLGGSVFGENSSHYTPLWGIGLGFKLIFGFWVLSPALVAAGIGNSIRSSNHGAVLFLIQAPLAVVGFIIPAAGAIGSWFFPDPLGFLVLVAISPLPAAMLLILAKLVDSRMIDLQAPWRPR